MAAPGTATVEVEVKPKVSVGVTTIVGFVAAAAQYAVAIAAFVESSHDEPAIGVLVTATVTLITTLGGRFSQATAAARAVAPYAADAALDVSHAAKQADVNDGRIRELAAKVEDLEAAKYRDADSAEPELASKVAAGGTAADVLGWKPVDDQSDPVDDLDDDELVEYDDDDQGDDPELEDHDLAGDNELGLDDAGPDTDAPILVDEEPAAFVGAEPQSHGGEALCDGEELAERRRELEAAGDTRAATLKGVK